MCPLQKPMENGSGAPTSIQGKQEEMTGQQHSPDDHRQGVHAGKDPAPTKDEPARSPAHSAVIPARHGDQHQSKEKDEQRHAIPSSGNSSPNTVSRGSPERAEKHSQPQAQTQQAQALQVQAPVAGAPSPSTPVVLAAGVAAVVPAAVGAVSRPAVVSEDTAVLLMQLSSSTSSSASKTASAKRKQKDDTQVKSEDDVTEPGTKRAASASSSEEDENDSESFNKKRGSLPKSTTNLLKAWLFDHHGHPYPTESEKQEMAQKFGLTVNQISNWFINARRRILQPMKEKAKKFLVQHSSTNGNSDSTDEIVHNALKRCVQDVTQSLGQPGHPGPVYEFHHPHPMMAAAAAGAGAAAVPHPHAHPHVHPQPNMMSPNMPPPQHQHQHQHQHQPQAQSQRVEVEPQPIIMEAAPPMQMAQPQYVLLPPGVSMSPHMVSGPMIQQQAMPPRTYSNFIYPPSTAMYHQPQQAYPQHLMQHHPQHFQYIPTTSFQGGIPTSAVPGIPSYSPHVRPPQHQLQPVYLQHDMGMPMMGAPPSTHHS